MDVILDAYINVEFGLNNIHAFSHQSNVRNAFTLITVSRRRVGQGRYKVKWFSHDSRLVLHGTDDSTEVSLNPLCNDVARTHFCDFNN